MTMTDTYVLSKRSIGRQTSTNSKMTSKVAVIIETRSVVAMVEMDMAAAVGIQSLRIRLSSTIMIAMVVDTAVETTP